MSPKKQTIILRLFPYDISSGEEHPMDGNDIDIVERESLWNDMVKQAPMLVRYTADMWEWFGSNYDIVCKPNEQENEILCTMTGAPNYNKWTEGEIDVEEWIDSVSFTLTEKGTHEQFDSAQLYKSHDVDIIIQIELL